MQIKNPLHSVLKCLNLQQHKLRIVIFLFVSLVFFLLLFKFNSEGSMIADVISNFVQEHSRKAKEQ